MKKYNINNHLKGRIQAQMPHLIEKGLITFAKGNTRNTCIVEINTKEIDSYEIEYIQRTLVSKNREIKKQEE